MVHIVILEDHPLYCFGLKYHFESNPDFRIAGDARTSADFFRLLDDTPANMALIGVNLPDRNNCSDVVRRLRKTYPAIKIFAIVSEDTRPIVQSMMKAGINGYIGKRQAIPDEFENAIRKIAAGEQYIGRVDTNAHLMDISLWQEKDKNDKMIKMIKNG